MIKPYSDTNVNSTRENSEMEDLLSQLIKEATGPKLINLKNASQNAFGMISILNFLFLLSIPMKKKKCFYSYIEDKLHRQHGTNRDASYELRSVCLTAIQMAIETKRAKFISLALNGMHVSV